MRLSIETRKTALVELALDLIQRLIAHRALVGRVYSINHRRDLAAGVKTKRRGGEEDDEDTMEEFDVLPPQVCNPWVCHGAQVCDACEALLRGCLS